MTFLQTDLIRATARLQYGGSGQDLINVMYLEMLSPSSLSDALTLADVGQILEIFYTPLLGQINLSVSFVDYTVQNITQDAAPLTATWPTLTIGGNANDSVPPQVAALVLTRTAKSRKFGRVFLAGISEASVSGSAWGAGALTAFANFGAALLTSQVLANSNMRYGVASAAVPPPRDIVNSFDVPISTATVAFARTQRRRSTGFGS